MASSHVRESRTAQPGARPQLLRGDQHAEWQVELEVPEDVPYDEGVDRERAALRVHHADAEALLPRRAPVRLRLEVDEVEVLDQEHGEEQDGDEPAAPTRPPHDQAHHHGEEDDDQDLEEEVDEEGARAIAHAGDDEVERRAFGCDDTPPGSPREPGLVVGRGPEPDHASPLRPANPKYRTQATALRVATT